MSGQSGKHRNIARGRNTRGGNDPHGYEADESRSKFQGSIFETRYKEDKERIKIEKKRPPYETSNKKK